MRNLIVLIVIILEVCLPIKNLALSQGTNLLFHKVWLLKKIQGVDVPQGATLTFETQKVTGSSGCNNFWSPVEYKGTNVIDIGPPQSARLYCFRAMALERAYLAALESINKFNLEGNTLKMIMDDGSVFLEFQASSETKQSINMQN